MMSAELAGGLSYKLSQEVPPKLDLKYNVKRGCIFHFNGVGIPFIFILSVKIKGVGERGFSTNKIH